MLGHSVPYLLMDADTGRVWFRLSNENRVSGGQLSASLIAAFRRAYPGMSCGERRMTCSESIDRSPGADLDDMVLSFAEISDDNAPGPGGGWTGAAARLTAADPGDGAVFLICDYR